MVWQVKKYICMIVCVCIMLLAYTHTTFAYSIYDGSINNTYTNIFKDIVKDISINDNYVFFRSGQYSYTLVAGPITFDNNKFVSSEECREYNITTQSNYNNNGYIYTVNDINNFSLNISDELVYSNLGNYPALEEGGILYDYASLLVLCIIGICVLFRPIFAFTYRFRNGN